MSMERIEREIISMVRMMRQRAEDHANQYGSQIDLLRGHVDRLAEEVALYRSECLDLKAKLADAMKRHEP